MPVRSIRLPRAHSWSFLGLAGSGSISTITFGRRTVNGQSIDRAPWLSETNGSSTASSAVLAVAFAVFPVRAVLYTPSPNAEWLIAVQLLDGTGILWALTPLLVADLMRGTGRYNLALDGDSTPARRARPRHWVLMTKGTGRGAQGHSQSPPSRRQTPTPC